MKQTRKEYIESELTQWKERYEIGFEEEFDLKTMLHLQYQLMVTPFEHVKTIGDIVHTKNQIMKNLNLKPKYKNSYSPEIWFVDLERNYENIEENKYTYKLRFVKMNQSNGKTKVIGIKKKCEESNLKDLANLLLSCILAEKPNKLFIDSMGVGFGLLDSLRGLIEINRKVMINDKGDLLYFNN